MHCSGSRYSVAGNDSPRNRSLLLIPGRVALGGIRTGIRRRGIAIAAVVAIHVALVTALVLGLRAQISQSSVEKFAGTWIVLSTQSARPRFRVLGPRQRTPPMGVRPVLVEPLPLPPRLPSLGSVDKRIDWAAEARRAAERVIAAPEDRQFGRNPAFSVRARERPSPTHYAGESYRNVYGDRVYWVSDSCYLVSDNSLAAALALPGAPALPRTVCVGSVAPRGDLFKDLPAYKKHHPQ